MATPAHPVVAIIPVFVFAVIFAICFLHVATTADPCLFGNGRLLLFGRRETKKTGAFMLPHGSLRDESYLRVSFFCASLLLLSQGRGGACSSRFFVQNMIWSDSIGLP